jgi:hypothetical protein
MAHSSGNHFIQTLPRNVTGHFNLLVSVPDWILQTLDGFRLFETDIAKIPDWRSIASTWSGPRWVAGFTVSGSPSAGTELEADNNCDTTEPFLTVRSPRAAVQITG